MEYDNLSFPEAVEALAEMLGIEVPRDAVHTDERRGEHDELYALLARGGSDLSGRAAREPAGNRVSEEARHRRPDGGPFRDGLCAGRRGTRS